MPMKSVAFEEYAFAYVREGVGEVEEPVLRSGVLGGVLEGVTS